MALPVSPTTGESWYSGSAADIKLTLKVLNMEAKIASLQDSTINQYQESVDREIDDMLGPLYVVPLRAMNQIQPDGTTKRVFPGSLAQGAKYWTAGLLLMTEFQQLSSNQTGQIEEYIAKGKATINNILKASYKLYGQEMRSSFSRTMPPNMQPPMPGQI